jgi:hypothetical protein
LRNPYPVEIHGYDDIGTVAVLRIEWIDASELHEDALSLRRFFKRRLPQLFQKSNESLGDAVKRIGALATVALDHCEAGKWSDKKTVRLIDPPRRYARAPWSRYHAKKHIGAQPPKKRPADGCLWLDTSTPERPLRIYSKKLKAWTTPLADTRSWTGPPVLLLDAMMRATGEYGERWNLRIGYAIKRMLSGQMGRIGKSGRPAYLTAAILADLLGETITTIADKLDAYRR